MKKNYRMKSLAVLLTAALALGGCQSSTDEAETETADTSLAVEAAVPEVGDLSVSSTFIGTISPQEQVSIIPLVSGEVSSVHFQVGDQVQAGDVCCFRLMTKRPDCSWSPPGLPRKARSFPPREHLVPAR